jgi:hypothetical protein
MAEAAKAADGDTARRKLRKDGFIFDGIRMEVLI